MYAIVGFSRLVLVLVCEGDIAYYMCNEPCGFGNISEMCVFVCVFLCTLTATNVANLKGYDILHYLLLPLVCPMKIQYQSLKTIYILLKYSSIVYISDSLHIYSMTNLVTLWCFYTASELIENTN